MNKILKFFMSVGLVLFVGNTFAQQNAFYGGCIFVEEKASQKIKETANELSSWLKKGTRKEFSVVSTVPQAGIFLLKTDSSILPELFAGPVKNKGKEAFIIRSQGSNKLFIAGNSDTAIQYGIYKYLEILGYRWFFPNENWTIVPDLKKITINANLVEFPVFKIRNFFGTGGFGGKLPVDPEMKLSKKWEEWKKRNFLGGEIAISGHAGESFNAANKAVLLEHPEYLAEINGKRQPFRNKTMLFKSRAY